MIRCGHCGKLLQEGSRFCAFCGQALKRSADDSSPEVKQWLLKAGQASDLIRREKILMEARSAFPDTLSVEYELLFIGHRRQGKGSFDFSIIKSYLLHMYFDPGLFSEQRKQENRTELFEDPQLLRCQSLSEDPELLLRDYLVRLSTEYFDVFLTQDHRINRSLFGFRFDRNADKAVSRAIGTMAGRMLADEQLPPDRREQLYNAFVQAAYQLLQGKTEWLDEALKGLR